MTDQNAPANGRREVRRGGRAARKAARAVAVVEAQASAPAYITRQIPLMELCSEEGLDIIEANAETILEEIGIDFKDDPDVLDIWRNAGADVDGERVRFPKGLARTLMATAPTEYTQHARNPARNVQIGGDNTVFLPVYGPPSFTTWMRDAATARSMTSRTL